MQILDTLQVSMQESVLPIIALLQGAISLQLHTGT